MNFVTFTISDNIMDPVVIYWRVDNNNKNNNKNETNEIDIKTIRINISLHGLQHILLQIRRTLVFMIVKKEE